MFHLLVAYRGWPEGGGTIPTGRIYIKEDDQVSRPFVRDGKLNLSTISRIPALLTSETDGAGPQLARVAYITSIAPGPRDTAIQYAVDESIKPISNADLERWAAQLGITRTTLTHTHWAIKEADLFKVLLMNQQARDVSPRLFSIEALDRQDQDLVSVMMPFHAEYDSVYSSLQDAARSVGMSCKRADNAWEHEVVVQDIVDLIAKARVVICDFSGRNPNVFYEAGIAHTLGKEVIPITQSKDDVPFDLSHIRYVQYLNNEQGRGELSRAVASRLGTIASRRHP